MADDILNALHKVQDSVRGIRHLNRGGCGVFAALVGRELEAKGVEPEVIVQDDWYGDSPAAVRERVSNNLDPFDWQDNGLSIAHAGLRFKHKDKWWTFDSTALLQSQTKFSDDEREVAEGSLTVTEIEAMAFPKKEVHKLWNPEFDRRQIPKLRKLVKGAFNQAET